MGATRVGANDDIEAEFFEDRASFATKYKKHLAELTPKEFRALRGPKQP